MKLQHGGWLLALCLCAGCATDASQRWSSFEEVTSHEPGTELRALRSEHYELFTSIPEPKRRVELVTALETAFDSYCRYLNVTPEPRPQRMECYVFRTAAEWMKFTVSETGEMAPTYLQTRRGGYTFGKFFASHDAGAQDTLTVAAHEGLHLFITSHFKARPPPFVEEGIACCFESVRRGEKGISINVGENGSRNRRLALAVDEKKLQPLRKLLSMHAGEVIDLDVLQVETFYAQAWAFVRFLNEGEGGAYRPIFLKMIADAQAGRLSSEDLSDNPAMMERYLGVSLDIIQPQYERFVVSLAHQARLSRE